MSNYKELKDYLADDFSHLSDVDAFLKIVGKQMDHLELCSLDTRNNNFIYLCCEETLSMFERFLYIPYVDKKSIAERRNIISALLTGSGHIGKKEIIDCIHTFTEGEISVTLIVGAIEISIIRGFSNWVGISDCLSIIKNRIPAHLALIVFDILLPVRLINTQNSVFKTLKLNLRLSNFAVETIYLDGRRNLDGSWSFDQLFNKWIAFHNFNVAFGMKNENRISEAITLIA